MRVRATLTKTITAPETRPEHATFWRAASRRGTAKSCRSPAAPRGVPTSMGSGRRGHRIRYQAGGGFPEEEQHPEKASSQADPAYGVFRTPGSDQSAAQGESEKGYEEHQIIDIAPRARRLRGWGTVQGQRGHPKRSRRTWPQRGQRRSRLAWRRRGCSSHRLLDPVLLSLRSQCHCISLPSLKCYDIRYEDHVLT